MSSRTSRPVLPYQFMDSQSLQDLIDSCVGWTDPESHSHRDAFMGEKMRRLFYIGDIETTIPDLSDVSRRAGSLHVVGTQILQEIADSLTDNTDPYSFHIWEDCMHELMRRQNPGKRILCVRWRVKIPRLRPKMP